ncbi:apoptosis-associated speck-like protein containing a CARD [Hemitrygon akajei]|uniref:apoptosis-associated speck-like protein containing a CARD n=1 Tax=Hemitrygon akajei TaxID=2704970 RepID=UPI003BF9C616
MSRTVRQCIVEALENLGRSQLRRFKEDLSEVQYRPGFGAIPRGRLEDADALDLGRLLVSSYRDDYAAELTLQVLEALPEREVADSLRRSLLSPDERQATGTGPRGRTAHPVDLYHYEIVQRFHSADSVLDRLLGRGTITAEQYELARAQPTRTEKNRALLRIVGDKGKEAKGQLWRDMELEDAMFTRSLTGH